MGLQFKSIKELSSNLSEILTHLQLREIDEILILNQLKYLFFQ